MAEQGRQAKRAHKRVDLQAPSDQNDHRWGSVSHAPGMLEETEIAEESLSLKPQRRSERPELRPITPEG